MIELSPAFLHVLYHIFSYMEVVLFRSLSIRCIKTSSATPGVRVVESTNLLLSPRNPTKVILHVHLLSFLLSF